MSGFGRQYSFADVEKNGAHLSNDSGVPEGAGEILRQALTLAHQSQKGYWERLDPVCTICNFCHY